jgi:hypothetical protein
MLRLLEITYTNDKESVSLYDNYADETALSAAFDTKLGQAIKADAYKAELLVAFAQTGQILAQSYHTKDDTIELSPRLVWVNVSNGTETADQKKESTLLDLEGDFYAKRGAAKADDSIDAITLIGVDGKSVIVNDYWSRPTPVI